MVFTVLTPAAQGGQESSSEGSTSVNQALEWNQSFIDVATARVHRLRLVTSNQRIIAPTLAGRGMRLKPPGTLSACPTLLEFVPQAELEHSRTDERGRVLPEAGWIQNAGTGGVRVETHRVCHVEGLGAELDGVWLVPDGKEIKPLANTQVDAEKAIASDAVALAGVSRERERVGRKGSRGIGEHIRAGLAGLGGRGPVLGCLERRNHAGLNGVRAHLPVGRPDSPGGDSRWQAA